MSDVRDDKYKAHLSPDQELNKSINNSLGKIDEKRAGQWAYGIAIGLWLIVSYFFGFLTEDWIVLILVSIPILVFINNLYYISSDNSNQKMTMSNGGSYIKIILTLFLTWALTDLQMKKKITQILLFALSLLIISLIQVYTPYRGLEADIKNILQTMSIVMILIVVYLYAKKVEHVHKGKVAVGGGDLED